MLLFDFVLKFFKDREIHRCGKTHHYNKKNKKRYHYGSQFPYPK